MHATHSTTTWQPRRTRGTATASPRTARTATTRRHAGHHTPHATPDRSVQAWARRAAGANGFGDA